MRPQLDSQSFLGPESDAIFAATTAGVIGLGGGGSHIAQQIAHLGIGTVIAVDPDIIEHKNLNRLVGGKFKDVKQKRPKVEIAERIIKGINPDAIVIPKESLWQNQQMLLRASTVIFGCVDSYRERDELERFCRRFLIPYIDVGMDVHQSASGYTIGGQVVLSTPGNPCLRCLGIVTNERIKQEAARYGAAGLRPQVVWINGALASLAVGLFVQMVAPWHDNPISSACCEFDGNRHLVESNRFKHLEGVVCRHYPAAEVGDPFFTQVDRAA